MPSSITDFAPSVTFAENSVNATPQLIDSDVAFTTNSSLVGGRLVVAGLLAQDRVSILAEGNGAGQIEVSGSTVSYGGVTIGTATGGVGGDFTVTFNSEVTGAAVDALIQRLAYGNVSDAPTTTRTLTLDVVDAAGGHLAAWPTPQFRELTGSANPLNGIRPYFSDRSTPAFVDLDGNGRRDLVMGNSLGTLDGWRNSGRSTGVDTDGFTDSSESLGWWSVFPNVDSMFSSFDVGTNSTPTFVDLDGDGRLDLVSGTRDGTLLAWRNTSRIVSGRDFASFTPLTGAAGSSTANPLNGIDVGLDSTPSFVDLDADGRLDLVSGTSIGTLRAWRNNGTAAAPSFTELTDTANPFNGIDVGSYSTPSFVDLDGDGRLDLVSGESNGTLLAWRNTVGGFMALTGAAGSITGNPFSGIDVGDRSAPTFVDLNGDGRLDLVIGETDGNLNTWLQTSLPWTTVTVTAGNDTPVITSAATALLAENRPTGDIFYQGTATNPDGSTGNFTWSLSGADAARFTMDTASGAVRFNTSPNFEAPEDAGGTNVYDITVTASDGALSSLVQAVAITVKDARELTGLAPSVSFGKSAVNAAPRLLDSDVAFSAGDSLANGRLVVAGLLAEDRVSILTEGNGAGQIGVSGSTISYGGMTIGTATGGAGGDFTVTFNSAVTGAAVDALIQRLAYSNTSDAPTATRTLTLDVVDAAGGHLAATPMPKFTALAGTANPFNSIDVGDYSVPNFLDLDGDGLLDLVVGEDYGSLEVWRNTGTVTASAFTRMSDSVYDISDVIQNMRDSKPAFGDVDGDGLFDLVVGGDFLGELKTWRNTGTATAPIFTQLTGTANPFNGSNAGSNSAPAFVDLDGDGRLDLVSGASDGKLMAWRNTGSGFTALTGAAGTSTANPFNGFDVGSRSAPTFVDLDGDGDFDLVSGNYDGSLLAWRNTGITTLPVFTALTGTANPFNGIDVGFASIPTFVDLDGDGRLDLVSGEGYGRLKAWRNTMPLHSITVTVTAQSETPVITSGGAASFAENRPAGDIFYQGTATNPDGSTGNFTWSLSGTDAARFTIDTASGAVRFNTSPNFEAPTDVGGNNVYDITVTASDAELRSTTQAVAITVTNVNEAPSVTSSGTVSFAENGTGTAYQAAGSDPDAGTTLSWTLGGADAALFNVSSTGAVRFNTSPNFEAPADAGGNNVYDITVTASDGALSSAARAVAISVTDVEGVPTLTGFSPSVTFNENTVNATPQLLDSDVVFTAFESLAGGRVVVAGLLVEDRVSILTEGNGAGQIGVSGSTISYGGVTIGSASGGVGGDFTVTLNTAVTGAAVDALIQRLAYSNISNTPTATRTLNLDVVDADGRHLAATPLPSITVTVTAQNDTPVITSAATALSAENRPAGDIIYQGTATDPDGSPSNFTWSLVGTDAARFTIDSASGAVRFNTSPNFEAPTDVGGNNVYDITVTASDGVLTGSKAVAITVTDVLESASTLTDFAPSVTFAENSVNATPQLIDSDVTFTTTTSLAGGRMVVGGLLAQDRVSILTEGNGAGQIGVSGGTISYGGVTIGTATGGVGGNLTVTFDSAVTGAAVDALIQRLAYRNISDTPTATRTLTLDVVNAAGGYVASPTPQFTELTGSANPFDGFSTFGGRSTPTFVDLDGNGQLDLVMGNRGGGFDGWRNSGRLTGVATDGFTFGAEGALFWTWPSIDSRFSGFNVRENSASTFVDLDGDGRLDLVSGTRDGTLLAWRNTSTILYSRDFATFTPLTGAAGSSTANPLNGIDVGLDSTPSFVDLDGDGLLDLVSGTSIGTLLAWRNTGTAAAPVFTALTSTANPFNGIDVGSNSTPSFVDLDGDGRLDLVSGASNGTLLAWRNTVSGFMALTGAAGSSTANPFSGIDVGDRSAPTFVDLNGDGRLDLVIGDSSGYLKAWLRAPLPWTAVTVTAENDTPIITSAATALSAENRPAGDIVYQGTATNPDGSTVNVTWSLSGADAARFTIDTASGAVRFNTSPNFEAPEDAGGNNVYDITVTASDGALSNAAQAVAITVKDVRELIGLAPSLTFAESAVKAAPQLLDSIVAFSAGDSLANGKLVVAGLLAEDRVSILTEGNGTGQIGVSDDTISYGGVTIGTATGGAGVDFTVTFNSAVTGAAVDALIQRLAYGNVSDAPTATRTLTLDVMDAAGTHLAATVMPQFTALTGTDNPFNVVANASRGKPSFVDLDGDGRLDLVSGAYDGTFRAWRNTGSGFTELTGTANPFNGLDAGNLWSTPTFVDLNGDGRLDLVSVGDGRLDSIMLDDYGALRVWSNTISGFTALTGTANPFSGMDVGSRSAPTFVDLDGDGRLDLVLGTYEGTLEVWRNTGSGFTALTGTANPFNGLDLDVGYWKPPSFRQVGSWSTPTFVDLDGDGRLDLVSGVYDGTLKAWRNTGSGFTELTGAVGTSTGNPFNGLDVGFYSAPSFGDLNGDGRLDLVSGAYDGTLKVWRNTTPLHSITVTVTENEAPVITSGGTASFAENRPAGDIIYQGTMQNAGGSPSNFIWSLSGADAARFAIDTASGAVRFNTSPNFEAPADAGGDNIYDITVTASDGALRSASQAVAITVTNVNEAPLISSAATASFAENGTGIAYQATGSDPDGGITLNWTLGGADAALFNIGATTGAVRFNTSPNFEAPGDMGGNNVYDITVTASDGLLRSAARAVAISVTDVVGATQNGTAERDVLTVGTENAGLSGLVGNDALVGGAVSDTLEVGASNHVFVMSDALDLIIETAGGGTDIIITSVGMTMPDSVAALQIAAGISGITVTGSAGNDTLIGNGLSNTLNGGAGDDVILVGNVTLADIYALFTA